MLVRARNMTKCLLPGSAKTRLNVRLWVFSDACGLNNDRLLPLA
jgi:hypothetical protein